MKRRLLAILLVGLLVLTGCTSTKGNGTTSTGTVIDKETGTTTTQLEEDKNKTPVRVVSLKGPTSMGLVKMMEDNKAGKTANDYQFEMVIAADEIVPKIVKGDIDIAAVPANLAAVINAKTKGGVKVIDINTLGVLYVVENGNQITSIADLKGKTVYMTGKGTTPEYTLNYLLDANGLSRDEVKVEFKSEPTEVAAILQKEKDVIAILPQPFATVAGKQNDNIRVALDLTKEWNRTGNKSSLITGVTIVRNEFLEQHKESVDLFLEEHKKSAEYANANVEETAILVEAADIVKAAIAITAIPLCNIVSIEGTEMKEQLSGYLQVLFDQNPKSVGGSLPDETFYYTK